MINWGPPGYEIVFTTRLGGVSEGAYASLNLGAATDDAPDRVDENRRRACALVGAAGAAPASNRQVHSALVNRAAPGSVGVEGDGLWTDEPGLPLLALAADCVPIALARSGGERRLVVLHVGWRGLEAGIIGAGVRAAAPGTIAAAVGPSIGPCCYDVGPEVSELFEPDLTRDGKLDLWAAAERRLRAAGVASVERVDLCTACHPDLFFSHRRDRGVTGRQGVVGVVKG